MGLRILITNNGLAVRAGSELYVRDVALSLLKRGHEPIVYSTLLGDVARELRTAKVEVVDNLKPLTAAPDLIHGHHHLDTMTALLNFPRVPAINFCHSVTYPQETPVCFPRVLRYVAVDYACRDRLLEHGIPAERIRVLLNFVDLDRFRPRDTSLPSRPRRALVFSNYAGPDTHLPVVQEACNRAELQLDVIGVAAQNASAQPEKILRKYDLVFAKARCALEAMAVGTAVILCDRGGVGPLVTMDEFDELRPLNFGIRTLREPMNPDVLLRQIERYDALDAAAVSGLVRATAGHEAIIDELLNLYQEVINEQRRLGPGDSDKEGRAAAAYLRRLKIDFAIDDIPPSPLADRVRRIPLLGGSAIKLARRIKRVVSRGQ